MPCPYDSGKRREVSFYYRQVAGKPPTAPLGPHDCEDVHVRARPIRLSTAEREVTRPLSIMPQSTDQRPNNRSDYGNKDNPNEGNKNSAGGNEGGEVKRRSVVIQVLLQWFIGWRKILIFKLNNFI